jgi:HAAS
VSGGPIDDYLAELRRRVPWHARGRRRFLDELRDHLEEAADAAGASVAMTRNEAEQQAVRRMGPPSAAVTAFSAQAPSRAWVPPAVAVVVAGVLAGALVVTKASSSAHRGATRAAPTVTLAAWARTTIPISGGTRAMRARARRILDGIGRTNIVRVAFGRPRDGFRQFRAVPGPIWLSVTIGSDGLGLRRFLDTGPPLWGALVFEHSYEGTQPAGSPSIRGTTELVTDGRHTLPFESEPAGREAAVSSPTPAVVARVVRRAARASAFRLDSVRLVHAGAGDLAASVVLTVLSRRDFARRLEAFGQATQGLSDRLYGFATTFEDSCGDRVFVNGVGFEWANARWLCPNPFVLGPLTSRRECARLAREQPTCSAAA